MCSLDLVGKLHRTIYIVNCPEGVEEQLATLFMRRCGAIEAWEVLDQRVVVVFESMNSISTALAFNGMSFVDLTKTLIVWKAKDPPPPQVASQLALTAGEGSGAPATEEEIQSHREYLEKRKERHEKLRSLGAEFERLDEIDLQNRDEKMKEWCIRQAKALVVILEDAVDTLNVEVKDQFFLLDSSKGLKA